MPNIQAVEDELFASYLTIEAAENWADDYSKDPKTHAKLIRSGAKMERDLRRFFREMSKEAFRFIDWSNYNNEVHAAINVKVLVRDTAVEYFSSQFMKIVFQQVAESTTLGANYGEQIYHQTLGIGSTDDFIQDAARERVATLVGKRVLKSGQIVDNPNKSYSVTDKLVSDIKSSLMTSIGLGETTQQASARIGTVIDNPSRAATIARTESVNAFGKGLQLFGQQSGAVGKEWQDNGAVDVCKENADAGPIPIDELFPSGDSEPGAHPNCRCIMRLVYQNELDDNPNLFDWTNKCVKNLTSS